MNAMIIRQVLNRNTEPCLADELARSREAMLAGLSSSALSGGLQALASVGRGWGGFLGSSLSSGLPFAADDFFSTMRALFEAMSSQAASLQCRPSTGRSASFDSASLGTWMDLSNQAESDLMHGGPQALGNTELDLAPSTDLRRSYLSDGDAQATWDQMFELDLF